MDDDDDAGDEGIDINGPKDSALPNLQARSGSSNTRPSSFAGASGAASTSLEARIEADGAKLRAAERKAGERSRSREQADGVRWRGEQRLHAQHLRQQSSRSGRASGEWSGQRGMPGAMPGG